MEIVEKLKMSLMSKNWFLLIDTNRDPDATMDCEEDLKEAICEAILATLERVRTEFEGRCHDCGSHLCSKHILSVLDRLSESTKQVK